ncbi:MAG: hypothetical protein ACF8MJ_11820 [Phycisphaerales bacterium JB050]
MTTKPETVNAVLEALLDREASYPAIARSVGMTLDELFEFLENPDMQAKIQRMQRLLNQRAALLTAANEAAREDEAKRANLVIERRRAIQNEVGPELIAMLDDSIAHLDGRHRRRVETMRTARSILTQARAASRPGANAAAGSGRLAQTEHPNDSAPATPPGNSPDRSSDKSSDGAQPLTAAA